LYLLIGCSEQPFLDQPTKTFEVLMQDIIINADLWSSEPQILSAGYGFEGIMGVAGGEPQVREAGGTWNTVNCSDGGNPPRRALTSSATPDAIAFAYGFPTFFADAMPIVFSWPVLPSTVDPTDFLLTLNTGEQVVPEVASINPCVEFNERHVVVIFGEFGNRGLPDEPGSIFPVQLEVVADDTPLMLVGPEGPISAVGLSQQSSNPYVEGPTLVGAKISKMSILGEGAPLPFSGQLPNDGVALYGNKAQYRLRVYTTGGFSPDGVVSVLPTEFSRYFRLHALDVSEETTFLTETGTDYMINGGTVHIEGLADLGPVTSDGADGSPAVVYDDCYIEDHDNYIDIVLSGDLSAMRNITHVEIPATDGYSPFFNPGGPGNNPTPGVRYTAPGPSDIEPVIQALDNPMTVNYSP